MKQQFLMLFTVAMCILLSSDSRGQGPPITSDKPIMLGSKRKIVKTLTEIRKNNNGTFVYAPLMMHYLPTANSLIALHIPLLSSSITRNETTEESMGLGDINLLGKYQFFRKDGKGKTLRMVAKLIETIPTADNVGLSDFGLGEWQTYLAHVIGYETIKHGISHELGYKFIPNYSDEIKHKIGFGLPLLKPVYPVKQLNLYFEYNSNFFVDNGAYELFFAQGIQYAIKQFTFETAVQLPLVQHDIPEEIQRKYSIFLGTRYVF